MKKTLIIVFTLISIITHGQNMFPEKFTNCKCESFLLEGKKIVAEKQNDILLNEILNNIDQEILMKIRGVIYIQVRIDTNGSPCCLSLENNLNGKSQQINFKTIIDNHTNWTPPIIEDKKANVCAILKLVFSKKKITLKRLGFNMRPGMTELSRYVKLKQ